MIRLLSISIFMSLVALPIQFAIAQSIPNPEVGRTAMANPHEKRLK
jgi:hypothetical protein